MGWVLQVRVAVGQGQKTEWREVRPVGGAPYSYGTKGEAERMLRMCYPGLGKDWARVKERTR